MLRNVSCIGAAMVDVMTAVHAESRTGLKSREFPAEMYDIAGWPEMMHDLRGVFRGVAEIAEGRRVEPEDLAGRLSRIRLGLVRELLRIDGMPGAVRTTRTMSCLTFALMDAVRAMSGLEAALMDLPGPSAPDAA